MELEGKKIGVAMDFSKGSKAALKWAMDGLLKEGNNLFMIHIQHSQALESRNRMWSDSGSPESDKVMHGYGVEIEPEVLDLLRTISSQLQVNVFWKIYWGDAREKICEAAVHLHLDTLAMEAEALVQFEVSSDDYNLILINSTQGKLRKTALEAKFELAFLSSDLKLVMDLITAFVNDDYKQKEAVLLGSVTSYVLEHATCAVTVVKDRGVE
ncbi:Universal stress protein PHOS32 [Bienertia sinuspersici]